MDVADKVLASYTGRYLMPNNKLMITIRKAPEGLEASAKGMPVVKLHAESQTLFSFKEDNTRFKFLPDESGSVIRSR